MSNVRVLKERARLEARARRDEAHRLHDAQGEASSLLADRLVELLRLHVRQADARAAAPRPTRVAGKWDEPEHAAPRTTLGDLWPTHPTNDGSLASQLSPTLTREQAQRAAERIEASQAPAVAADVAAMMRGERAAEAIPALLAEPAEGAEGNAPQFSALFPEPRAARPARQALRVACYAAVGSEVSLAPFARRVAECELENVTLYAPVVLGPRHLEFVEVSVEELSDPASSGLAFLAHPARRTGAPEGRRFEPCGNLDVIIVPGLAFCRNGARLGQGGGHYDAFLAMLRAQAAWAGRDMGSWPQPAPARAARVIGVGYAAQVLEDGAIPLDGNDRPVDELVVV